MSLEIGKPHYLKGDSVCRKVTLLRLFDDLGGVAKVEHSEGGEQTTCRQSELLTEEQYDQLVKKRRADAYREERRIDLRQAISFWNNGLHTPEAMLENSKLKDLTYWKRQIRQAKKHNFITE